MQRRNFISLSSLAAAASAVPAFVSRMWAQSLAARRELKAASDSRVPATPTNLRIPRWHPHDFAFSSKALLDNPFTVDFAAEVTGPDGVRLTIPGFYDGHGTWKVRVAPAAEGSWSLVTRSSYPDLDKHQAAFFCTPNSTSAVHGGLRIDPEHASQFVCEDGTRFFPIGYECDWLWAIDTTDPLLKTIHPFLDKLSNHGFNFIILNSYAQDTNWRKGRTGDDDFGPPPLYAWEGSNERPDHSRFNLAYWQHYDRVMDALHRRGIVAHILIRVYNKQVNWPANGSAEDDLFYRWLIGRYAAYSNVTWDLAKEAHNEKDLAYKTGRLRYLRANDPYHRLLTVHDDRANYDRGAYDDLLDYRSDQQHTEWRKIMLTHLRQRAWPVINTEFGYECGPMGLGDKTYSVAQLPEEVCRRAWEVYMARGFGAYYYTYTAWDIIRPQDTPPGYRYFRNLRDFFISTGYWNMKPAEGLASEGYCLAHAGHEYIVFLNTSLPFTLNLEALMEPLAGEWYQPLSGTRRVAGTIANQHSDLTPPAEWGSGPVALHLVRAAKRAEFRERLRQTRPQQEVNPRVVL